MQRALLAIGAALLAGASAAAAQGLGKCTLGQRVIDRGGRTGVIVSGGRDLCVVRYPDGQIVGWTPANLRRGAAIAGTGAAVDASPPPTVITPQSASSGVTIIRPAPPPHSLSVRAHRGGRFAGHFVLTAEVDGTPIGFLVDTGASLVTLRLADAEAVGIRSSDLVFDHILRTASGRVRVALVTLHEISIGNLSVGRVAAAVGKVRVSVLGMDFLSRLKRFEINGDALTLEW
jgi:clan AA aspartic protease (TIGR02281 family)